MRSPEMQLIDRKSSLSRRSATRSGWHHRTADAVRGAEMHVILPCGAHRAMHIRMPPHTRTADRGRVQNSCVNIDAMGFFG